MKYPWVRTVRRETGLVENVCKCGVGHPAVCSADWMALQRGEDRDKNSWLVHGCCGCCKKKEWIIADLICGSRIANTNLDIVLRRNIAMRNAIRELGIESKVFSKCSDMAKEGLS